MSSTVRKKKALDGFLEEINTPRMLAEIHFLQALRDPFQEDAY